MISQLVRLCSAIIPPGTRQYLTDARKHFIQPLWRRRALARFHEFERRGAPFRLEIGSGPHKGKNGWTTMDYCRGCDLRWDLRNPLPFPERSVTAIYSSHFLEHLEYAALIRLLNECKRVLKEGGTFSTCVPNARPYLYAYTHPESFDVATFCPHVLPNFPFDTPINYVNYIFHMGGEHRHMFDEHSLLRILRSVGFRNARLREFNPDLDLLERQPYSIYADAER